MNRTNLAIFLVLVLVAAAGLHWLVDKPDVTAPFQSPTAQQAKQQEPDYQVISPHSLSYDSQGQLSRRLTGSQMLHYPDSGVTEIKAPRVELINNSQRWLLSADNAQGKPDEIFLQGAVLIHNQAPAQQRIRIETDHLTLYPEQKLAETDAQVVISQSHSTLRSQGLKIDFNTEQIFMLNQVRGQHDPNQLSIF